MIGIVDYGMGNLMSVYNALEYIGEDVEICHNPNNLINMSHIILPGVGSFEKSMSSIVNKGFYEILNNLVVKEKRPILGICLGMQIMAKKGFEGGECKGFGWLNSEVIRIDGNQDLKVPHIGWNSVDICNEKPLIMSGLPDNPEFYYAHSYYMKCKENGIVLATSDYGQKITSIVQHENIFGVQFHPEKSQDNGLKLLENFAKVEQC